MLRRQIIPDEKSHGESSTWDLKVKLARRVFEDWLGRKLKWEKIPNGS